MVFIFVLICLFYRAQFLASSQWKKKYTLYTCTVCIPLSFHIFSYLASPFVVLQTYLFCAFLTFLPQLSFSLSPLFKYFALSFSPLHFGLGQKDPGHFHCMAVKAWNTSAHFQGIIFEPGIPKSFGKRAPLALIEIACPLQQLSLSWY